MKCGSSGSSGLSASQSLMKSLARVTKPHTVGLSKHSLVYTFVVCQNSTSVVRLKTAVMCVDMHRVKFNCDVMNNSK